MPFADCVYCRSRFCEHQPDPQWLKPAYGYPAGQGVYSCGESFPVVAVGRDNVASQENRRVELVFAPKNLQLKGAPRKNVNMKAGDCAVYNREIVQLVSVVVLRNEPSVFGKICMSFIDLLDKPIKGIAVELSHENAVLWSGKIDNSYLEVLDVPIGDFSMRVDVDDASFTFKPAWVESEVDSQYQICQLPMILEEYHG